MISGVCKKLDISYLSELDDEVQRKHSSLTQS